MKTWEMIKELTENPDMRFEDNPGSIVGISSKTGRFVWFEEDGEESPFIIYSNAPHEVDNIHINWEPIPHEVTWQEAIAAWVEGKKIRCEIDGEEFKYHIKGSMTISKMELRRGKWFIE